MWRSRRFRVIYEKCQFPHTAENSGLLQLAVSSFFSIIIIFRKKQSSSHVAAEDFGLLQLTVCSFFFIIIIFRKKQVQVSNAASVGHWDLTSPSPMERSNALSPVGHWDLKSPSPMERSWGRAVFWRSLCWTWGGKKLILLSLESGHVPQTSFWSSDQQRSGCWNWSMRWKGSRIK